MTPNRGTWERVSRFLFCENLLFPYNEDEKTCEGGNSKEDGAAWHEKRRKKSGAAEDETLFGMLGEDGAGELLPTEGAVSELNVVRFKAETMETCKDWQELFRGFSHLKVITYSSSIPMLQKVLKLFDDVEVIFGNEAVLGNLEEILRNQYAAVSVLQNADKKAHGKMLERIQNGTLSFFVTKLHDHTSHQKLYLLSDEGEKYRVITGSANFTRRAFESSQLENILVSDDFPTYDLFYGIYQKTRALSTMQLTDKTLKLTNLSEIEELPAIREIVHAKKTRHRGTGECGCVCFKERGVCPICKRERHRYQPGYGQQERNRAAGDIR